METYRAGSISLTPVHFTIAGCATNGQFATAELRLGRSHTLANFFQSLAQADLIERFKRKLHEGEELSFKTTERGGECAAPLCWIIQIHMIGISPIARYWTPRPMRRWFTGIKVTKCEDEI